HPVLHSFPTRRSSDLLVEAQKSGGGGEPDVAKAKPLFEKYAEKGSASAMYCLGSLYAEGKGGEQDFIQARKWFEKAAEKGDAGRSEEHTSELQSRENL